MIFGTLKDGSLKFINLPLINYFSCSNVLQNGAQALSKLVLKNSSFCQKHHNFIHFGPYDLVQILPACGLKYVSNYVRRDFSLTVSAFVSRYGIAWSSSLRTGLVAFFWIFPLFGDNNHSAS